MPQHWFVFRADDHDTIYGWGSPENARAFRLWLNCEGQGYQEHIVSDVHAIGLGLAGRTDTINLELELLNHE
jgi:hypothetical protein